ncbi:MAG: hypothetical protein J4N98_05415, partial [Chloroflexi bacterium]|nr:hypothetical protein [Chloroflexota bacterium]
MTQDSASISRPAITKLLIGAVVMLGLLGLFVALAGNASAGGGTKVTVNTTANIDDGECEGAPNDDEIGNCSFREAINLVNNGDADIINFHKPVFSKEQPGVINLCDDDGGELPFFTREVVIDSKNSGVILDGGGKDDDCSDAGDNGLVADVQSNGYDFELNGGKNFTIRNFDQNGIEIWAKEESLGTIVITGIDIENVDFEGIQIRGTNLESLSITNSEIESTDMHGIEVFIDACDDADLDCKLSDSAVDISDNRVSAGVSGETIDADGVNLLYHGRINSSTKITLGVTQNEVINADTSGVDITFNGCGSGGFNVHVDENEDINGQNADGVRINIRASLTCVKVEPGGALAGIQVEPGNTSDGLEVVVTVNGNGDIENHCCAPENDNGVEIDINIGFEESDSSATVEVNDNGRITGEEAGVD